MNLIYFEPRGRLGNALFRYFAISILLTFNYSHQYGGLKKRPQRLRVVKEGQFLQYLNNPYKLQNEDFILTDFYQSNEIINYKKEIILFMKSHLEHKIYNFPLEEFLIKDIINSPNNLPIYMIVLHLRLEDFVNNKEFIPYQNFLKLFEEIKDTLINKEIGIVLNKPKTNFEIDYLQNIKQWFRENNIIFKVESNSILIDFHIMKNAQILICSNSTISWCAAFLSEKIEKCYMPNYKNKIRNFQTFQYPMENTCLYTI